MIKKIIFIIIPILLFISCESDELVVQEKDKLTESISTKHFDYFYSKSDQVFIDTTWQELYFEWLVIQLDVTVEQKLQYYKYRDNEHIKLLTGKSGNGFAEVGTYKFHTICFIDSHECVHIVVSQLIGHPPALFNEGIAVAHQSYFYSYPDFTPGWNGEDFNQIAKDHYQSGNLPSLDELLGVYTYWDYSSGITYPVSGSFVRYLIDNYGIEKMKSLISISDFHDTKEKIHGNFYEIYEFTIEDAWSEWNEYIENY